MLKWGQHSLKVAAGPFGQQDGKARHHRKLGWVAASSSPRSNIAVTAVSSMCGMSRATQIRPASSFRSNAALRQRRTGCAEGYTVPGPSGGTWDYRDGYHTDGKGLAN